MSTGAIAEALAAHALSLRGGFDFDDGEERPSGPSGRPARSVMLVGNAGADYWPHFQAWLERQPSGLENPLDTWSRQVVAHVAERFGARLMMPNDRPFAPFQQWAMRAEGLRPSPLGILIHPRFGLWHAYRAALLFDRALAPAAAASAFGEADHPCDGCGGKPCLFACPVDAFGDTGFAHADCLAHVRGPAGETCRETGCLARNACPVGTQYRYPAAVQAFHQRAFAGLSALNSRRRSAGSRR